MLLVVEYCVVLVVNEEPCAGVGSRSPWDALGRMHDVFVKFFFYLYL